jgi:uncharacterized protein
VLRLSVPKAPARNNPPGDRLWKPPRPEYVLSKKDRERSVPRGFSTAARVTRQYLAPKKYLLPASVSRAPGCNVCEGSPAGHNGRKWRSKKTKLLAYRLATTTATETMMQRNEAIAKLRQHEIQLRRLGVESLYLLGSTARDDAREDSDVDLFFDYERGKLGLFELMEVKEETSRILGRKADIARPIS